MSTDRIAFVDGPDPLTSPGQDRHPAPARGHASLSALWFGFLGGPAAWSVQTLVNTSLAAHSCFPRLTPLTSSVTGNLRGVVIAVSVVALVVCGVAVTVAWRTWWRTRGEQQEGTGRGREHQPSSALLETGEGRTRFMALAGVLTSITFLAVSAAHTAAILLVSPCGW
jgi:hypothetical protein